MRIHPKARTFLGRVAWVVLLFTLSKDFLYPLYTLSKNRQIQANGQGTKIPANSSKLGFSKLLGATEIVQHFLPMGLFKTLGNRSFEGLLSWVGWVGGWMLWDAVDGMDAFGRFLGLFHQTKVRRF